MSFSLHVATIDESCAQFSAPISWPANSAFLLVRQIGLMAFSTGLVSSSRRPSSRKRVLASKTKIGALLSLGGIDIAHDLDGYQCGRCRKNPSADTQPPPGSLLWHHPCLQNSNRARLTRQGSRHVTLLPTHSLLTVARVLPGGPMDSQGRKGVIARSSAKRRSWPNTCGPKSPSRPVRVIGMKSRAFGPRSNVATQSCQCRPTTAGCSLAIQRYPRRVRH